MILHYILPHLLAFGNPLPGGTTNRGFRSRYVHGMPKLANMEMAVDEPDDLLMYLTQITDLPHGAERKRLLRWLLSQPPLTMKVYAALQLFSSHVPKAHPYDSRKKIP